MEAEIFNATTMASRSKHGKMQARLDLINLIELTVRESADSGLTYARLEFCLAKELVTLFKNKGFVVDAYQDKDDKYSITTINWGHIV